MTHEEMNLNTKRAFAAALKKLMKTKPLDRITVKDLITECNVNRKTFYYHFRDIYDLLKWMLEEEAVNVVAQFDMLTDFQDAAQFVMDYTEENDHILKCAYDSVGRDELKHFLQKDFLEIIRSTVDRCEAELGLSVSPEYKRFLCSFYCEAISGVIIDRILSPKRMDRQTAISYMDTILFSSVPAALQAGTAAGDRGSTD